MGVIKNHNVNTKPMIWPRSRRKTPSAARNQQIPSVKKSCGIKSTGSQTTAHGIAPRINKQCDHEDPRGKEFRHQAGHYLVHRQRVQGKDQLLDEIAMFQDHERRAAGGLGEGQPGQHPGQKIQSKSGRALISAKPGPQHHPEHEKIRGHQQQRIENRPEHIAEGAAVPGQNVAASHGTDQPAVFDHRAPRVRRRTSAENGAACASAAREWLRSPVPGCELRRPRLAR